ncbi:DUF4440 domain-containing protein [Erythrobacter arachoides]|uniref:DUF4440 domain-containing protein n=1 Tax=Aurantiacibacter arachoides TaxID=1850444 RepID=A0A845A4G0_9SPHN|nr:nuclear transport factor 2 family protein [Aurantiacibacter arachoides]MXO94312.1 DUF4440 domain-containing protein [Aurantiacibacter arachoides]
MAGTLALAACNGADAPEPQASVAEVPQVADIEAALNDSAAGWNEGDMTRFLAVYSGDPRTAFVGGEEVIHGRGAIETRYRDRYDWSGPDPSGRGVLSFVTEDFRPLGQDHALYVGRYVLEYPQGKPPATGFTSLVFERENGKWQIISDHSS